MVDHPAKKPPSRPIEGGLIVLAFALFALFMVAPAYYVFKGSFQSLSISIASGSAGWTLKNYFYIFSEGYHIYVINSFLVCLTATALACAISLFAAYALSRFRFRGRGLVFGAIMGGQLFPWIILINPIFILFARNGLVNSHLSMIFIYTAVITPFSVYLLVGYLTTIPKSLDEAAIMDGASRFKIVTQIIMPLIMPGLVATATYGFLQAWSEYLLALTLLSDESKKTLPLGLYQYFGEDTVNWGALMAGSAIATLPTLLLFLPLQKKLVSGLTQGAVK